MTHLRTFLIVAMVLAAKPAIADSAGGAYPGVGEYRLGRIFRTPGSWVVEYNYWLPRRLSGYTEGAITLLSFFYSNCMDPLGCPAIWSTFESVHADVVANAGLHGKVRLVMISLDPAVDTPETLEVFSAQRRETDAIAPWNFLTTWSDRFLAGILAAFSQAAGRDLDRQGNPTSTISHQVKFFLIDGESWVREIYASQYADPEVILADIRTLLAEEAGGADHGK
jgi:cytochrome oxidase Cu insertion factor (SCO1/SenC/PrrC family)